jgi:hypothetical protein
MECYFKSCWVMPKRAVDLLACWKGVCGSPQGANSVSNGFVLSFVVSFFWWGGGGGGV